VRVAIVGGGISGLCAAHRLAELASERRVPLQIDLWEAGTRLGGTVWSESIDAYHVVDHGADMFITDKPWALSLCRRLGLEERLIGTEERNRRSLVLRDGKAVEVPAGFALMAPTQILPMAKTPLLSWPGKARAALDLVLPRRRQQGDESIASFVRRRFGSEMLDRMVQPLVGGIYTGDPEKLSLSATLPRFIDMERESRSITVAALRKSRRAETAGSSGARYGLFASLDDGMRTLVDRLRQRVAESSKISLGTRAASVVPKGEGWIIERRDGPALECDGVIVALPAYAAAELVRSVRPSLADRLARIPYASTAVVVTGHALADIAHPLDAFGLVIPHVERRKVLAVSFASRKLAGRAPEGSVQLRTFVGGALQPELYELSDGRIEGMVLDELRDLLGVEGPPDFIRVVRHPRSMPQYWVGHLDLVGEIEREVEALGKLALAGNGYRGVGIPDCVHSGEQAAESLFRALTAA
jgi:oxygen-dependent protoporphyrinogen oxidase